MIPSTPLTTNLAIVSSLTKDHLFEYLAQEHALDATEIDGNTLLFSDGLLDSFIMVELIAFIESKAGFRMKPTEVNMDNLDSIQRILDYVASVGDSRKSNE